ncbi:hypothetical protein G9A89_003773 [Geosiphon pyriformis]|nr:hypothetical protein G9A89_003773 [Geosiphon pyriformis]
MDELAINTPNLTRKKKKAKIDFVLDLNKASTSTANNNELPKTKKKTPKTNKCSHQTELVDNSNVTPLIYKAQVAGYFIDLILDSELSVSIIAKHFFETIGRKINEPSTRPMTNIHDSKKKDLDIAKAVLVYINDISIKTDMKVSEAKEYTIIVGNECGEKPIVVKYHHWTTPLVPKQNQKKEQLNESNNDKSDNKEDQEEQKETVELVYTIFTSNGKLLDNIKADKKKIMVNGKLICWPYYNILKKTFNRKPDKKAKNSYW